ncbi:MAG: hypothetical protein DCF20_18035 [Pseudanabaena sp.]|nr:MAG: hypothetical protein DCF20_18035 [Pseudanabaena sp.]
MNRLRRPLQDKRVSVIQAKLSIGEPNDKYEQEADATASKVVQQINSTPQDQSIQREESMEEEDEELQMKPISSIQREVMEEEEELQMKSLVQSRENLGEGESSPDLESSIQSARGSGQSLDPILKAKMGQAMGADFSGVKVHIDSQSDQLNKSIQAKAFTTGQDVFFRQGAYEPSSRGGQELIAHELTHVVQQTSENSHTHVKLQRLLSKDNPIAANEVQNVKNPHGLVYILKGANQDSVVVKFEVPTSPQESLSLFQARYKLGQELGEAVLDGNIERKFLDQNDINQLKLIPINANDDSGSLLRNLGRNIDQQTVGIKMDKLDMGKTLLKITNMNNKTNKDALLNTILDTNKCVRYGQMAYYDVLTRNVDRFQSNGRVMANNIDFDRANTDVIPLDNLGGMTSITISWQANLSEMIEVSKSKRKNYAVTAVNNLILAANKIPGDFGTKKLKDAFDAFEQGMLQAETNAHPTISKWEAQNLQERFSTRSAINSNADEKLVRQVLVSRYKKGLE